MATKQGISKDVGNNKGQNPLSKVNKLPPQCTSVFLDVRWRNAPKVSLHAFN
ncbi:hypothetical protein [Nostoc sp.]|uniref:hypothetical protein n=1 Tax=Nostoc sp. TaxID=1180 RepID=UPI002FFB247C